MGGRGREGEKRGRGIGKGREEKGRVRPLPYANSWIRP